ncbi:MAG: hypothetical protein RLO50_14100 [Azospirillaceae bacterium]
MKKNSTRIALIGTLALALAGCQNQGGQTMSAGGSAGASAGGGSADILPSTSALPQTASELGFAEDFRTGSNSLGGNTGTVIGTRIQQLQSEVAALQNQVAARIDTLQQARLSNQASASTYYANVAQIDRRLQNGTTPGNPILVQQWGEAAAALDRMSAEVSRLNSLTGQAVSDNAVGDFLLDSVRGTYRLPGGIEEDHRQLGILEDEIDRTLVVVERLLDELTDEITLQSTTVSAERSNLTSLQVAIANGEPYGASLINRAYPTAAGAGFGSAASVAAAPALNVPNTDPLIVVRFSGQQDVDYEQIVYEAVAQALERRPEATFSIIAVSPTSGTPQNTAIAANDAREGADEILRHLVQLGLPSSRISLGQTQLASAAGSEVRVYVR